MAATFELARDGRGHGLAQSLAGSGACRCPAAEADPALGRTPCAPGGAAEVEHAVAGVGDDPIAMPADRAVDAATQWHLTVSQDRRLRSAGESHRYFPRPILRGLADSPPRDILSKLDV
jgi:hypothetical protein